MRKDFKSPSMLLDDLQQKEMKDKGKRGNLDLYSPPSLSLDSSFNAQYSLAILLHARIRTLIFIRKMK
jgi:hypothetical protein